MDLTLVKVIDTLNIDAVQESIITLKDKGNDLERIKALIERILRTKALEFGCSTISIDKVDDFVKFVIGLAERDVNGIVVNNEKDNKICSKTLTIQILQDIFDISTTQRCEQLFIIIENNIHIWKTPFFFSSCKNMILRLCNDLLKRLSRFIDTTFCGRILILLAKSLPLNEKSGLNLPGHFNTQNVTVFDRDKKHLIEKQHQSPLPPPPCESIKQEEKTLQEDNIPSVSTIEITTKTEGTEVGVNGGSGGGGDDDMEIGEIRDHRSDSINGLTNNNNLLHLDYTLYSNFWELQRFFSNPNLLFEEENFIKFEQDILNVFGIFSNYKIDKPQQQKDFSIFNNNNCFDSIKQEEEDEEINEKEIEEKLLNCNNNIKKELLNNEINLKNNNNEDVKCLIIERTFCAKYLTSEKLFSFQMSDSQFRRYFLVQVLIINNYLASRTRPKEASELTIEQEDKLFGLIEKCYTLLKETYPNGSQFASSVKKLLNREKQWCSWKADGFPDLIGNVQQQLNINNNNNNKEEIIENNKQLNNNKIIKIIDLGNVELTRLWTIEKDNLFACKNIKRKNIPQLKNFLEDALDELDPEQQVEEVYMSLNNENYQWMASRFLLMNSDQHINHSSQDSSSVKMSDKTLEKGAIASFLKKSIYLASENIPELKQRSQQIQTSIDKINKLKQQQQENERLLKEQTKQQHQEKSEKHVISTTKTSKESEKHLKSEEKHKKQIQTEKQEKECLDEHQQQQQTNNNNNNDKHVSTTKNNKDVEQSKTVRKEEKLRNSESSSNNKKVVSERNTSKRKHKSDEKRGSNHEEAKMAKNPRK